MRDREQGKYNKALHCQSEHAVGAVFLFPSCPVMLRITKCIEEQIGVCKFTSNLENQTGVCICREV